MEIKNYKSNRVNYNKNFWNELNIITDVNEYNEIVDFGEKLGPHLKFTLKGHLRKEKVLKQGGNAVLKLSSNSFEYIMIYDGRLYRFAFIPGREEKKLSGIEALKTIEKEASDLLKPYAKRTNAEVQEIKNQISKYRIELTDAGKQLVGTEIDNVYHIDIHSAFPAGLCATHPEFKPIYLKHYRQRKEDEIHKAILNYSIGAMQSLKIRGNRYPELSRDAINWTNNYLNQLTKEIEGTGVLTVIGYNTDGIFVRGIHKFHNDLEGDEMGQWRIDHVYDKIRFKSAGAYEYIENGEYHAVVRGIPKKKSETFVWGDIFKHNPVQYQLDLYTNKVLEVEINEEEIDD